MLQTSTIAPTHAGRADVGELVEAMGAELDDVARVLSEAIHDHIGELDDDLRVWTLQSVRANLGIIVTMLREGTPPSSAVAPSEALGYAREYVRRGLPFDLLQRAYRIAQATLSRLWLQRARAATGDADHLVETLGFFSDWLFAWVETLERQLTEAYMAEREQWVRGAAAMRAAEVRALLEGARGDVPGASRRLGYELDRQHVGFVVWSDQADGDAADGQTLFSEMEQLAASVGSALGAIGLLTVPQGHHLACWAGAHEPPDVGDPGLARSGGAGLRVALGTPGHGAEGFARSHREALMARKVAKLCGRGRGRPGATLFTDVALDALATHDLPEARRFVEAELGPLAADDDAARRLSATLRVFLEESSSFVRAGRRLGVHENTVAYRVRRAEDLLGRRTTERQLELRVALRLARLVSPRRPA